MAADDEAATTANIERLLKTSVVKSASGRFTASGPDAVSAHAALRWAESVADDAEHLAGISLCFENRGIHISLRGTDVDVPRVVMEQETVGTRINQRLFIYGLDRLDAMDVDESLCRLILEGCVIEQSRRLAGEAGAPGPAHVPAWLAQGVARNLRPEMRARDTELVIDRWQRGEVASLSRLIWLTEGAAGDAAVGLAGTNDLERAVCGVFTGWLLSHKDRADLFKTIVGTLATGHMLTGAWLAGYLPGCTDIAEIDAAWDAWILRQKRVVREPGKSTANAVDQLRGLLLLYSGDSGIPQSEKRDYRRITLPELIESRRAEWMPAFCEQKCAALRVLALGRSKAFVGAVDAYCRFFDALGKGKRKGVLEERLQEAETAMATLEKETAEDGGEGAKDDRRRD